MCQPGPVLLKRCVRENKYELKVGEVSLIDCNPYYAQVQLAYDHQGTTSTRHLAPQENVGNRKFDNVICEDMYKMMKIITSRTACDKYLLYKKMPGWEELYENYHLSRCLCYASLLVYILLLSDHGFGFNIALILKFKLKSYNNS